VYLQSLVVACQVLCLEKPCKSQTDQETNKENAGNTYLTFAGHIKGLCNMYTAILKFF